MNTTAALFKKELHAAKWFLLGGILFFWSFPLLEVIGAYYRGHTLLISMPSSMALVFGAIFGIITASGMVCLDMPKGLYEFWRSRPVKLLPYMAVKYVAGLAVTLFVVTAPVLFEVYLRCKTDYMNIASYEGCILYVHPFIIIFVYSIAFCAGHIFRNMTETVVVSCAAALLAYFVPVLVPALEPLSFFNIIMYGNPNFDSNSQALFYVFHKYWIFMGTASILSITMIAAAWICLKHHLQVRLGMKSLCWCLGLVALILFSAAAFSVGSNLKRVAQIALPADTERVDTADSCFGDKGGVMLYSRRKPEIPGHNLSRIGQNIEEEHDLFRVDRISEGPSYAYHHESYLLDTTIPSQISFFNERTAWSKQDPCMVYFLGRNKSTQEDKALLQLTLYVIKLDDSTHAARQLGELLVGEYDTKSLELRSINIVLVNQKLYILLPDEIAVIDVGDSERPHRIMGLSRPKLPGNIMGGILFSLSSDTALSEEQRRYIAQCLCCSQSSSWDSNRYAEAISDLIRVSEVHETSNTEINLKEIASRNPLPLEKLMEYSPRKIILRGDIVYLLYANDNLSVYQLNESLGTLKNIGHYAAPEGRFYDMFLREDGLITLVGYKQIHIIQPPVAKKN